MTGFNLRIKSNELLTSLISVLSLLSDVVVKATLHLKVERPLLPNCITRASLSDVDAPIPIDVQKSPRALARGPIAVQFLPLVVAELPIAIHSLILLVLVLGPISTELLEVTIPTNCSFRVTHSVS